MTLSDRTAFQPRPSLPRDSAEKKPDDVGKCSLNVELKCRKRQCRIAAVSCPSTSPVLALRSQPPQQVCSPLLLSPNRPDFQSLPVASWSRYPSSQPPRDRTASAPEPSTPSVTLNTASSPSPPASPWRLQVGTKWHRNEPQEIHDVVVENMSPETVSPQLKSPLRPPSLCVSLGSSYNLSES